MNATVATPVAENGKTGDYTRVTAGPMNRSEEPRFGLFDVLIIAFFLMFAAGLGCLVLLH